MFQHDPNKKKHYNISRAGVIYSLNRALWGEVSSTLRATLIRWDQDMIHLFFYYDGEISEEDHESAECVATEVMADFPEHQFEIDILRLDYPKLLPIEGELVYHRREKCLVKKQHQGTSENEKDSTTQRRLAIILSAIDALLGEVSPELRLVRIDWNKKNIHMTFYYEGEISNEENESMERIRNKVISHFPDYQVKVDILRWDYPQRFPEDGSETVYRKKEPIPQQG